MTEVAERPKLDAVVERYVALRDMKAQLKAEYDRKVADIDTALDKCEKFLLATMNEQGVESMKTKAGTAYKAPRTSVTVADWDAFFGWVRENEAWAMLEHRVSKAACEEYREVHDDIPPGLNRRAEWVVNVRRS